MKFCEVTTGVDAFPETEMGDPAPSSVPVVEEFRESDVTGLMFMPAPSILTE